MKIIRSFFLLTACLSATTIVYAQEVKPEITKKPEVRTPAPPPGIKMQPEPVPALTDTPAVTENPAKLKADAKPDEQEKLEAIPLKITDIATPGGEAGRKIMEGNTGSPKDPIFSPSTTDPEPTMPVIKPAKSNRQQQ